MSPSKTWWAWGRSAFARVSDVLPSALSCCMKPTRNAAGGGPKYTRFAGDAPVMVLNGIWPTSGIFAAVRIGTAAADSALNPSIAATTPASTNWLAQDTVDSGAVWSMPQSTISMGRPLMPPIWLLM